MMFDDVKFEKNEKFRMPGTQGTNTYFIPVATELGQVGIRELGGGRFRVRVEPFSRSAAETLAPAFPGWKQPGDSGQARFSQMVYDGEAGLRKTLATALKALSPGAPFELNPGNLSRAKQLLGDLSVEPAAVQPPGESEDQESASPIAESEPTSHGFGALPPPHVQEAMDAKGGPLTAQELANLKPAETEKQERERLIASIRERKLPGCNAAGRWSTETLRRKAAQV